MSETDSESSQSTDEEYLNQMADFGKILHNYWENGNIYDSSYYSLKVIDDARIRTNSEFSNQITAIPNSELLVVLDDLSVGIGKNSGIKTNEFTKYQINDSFLTVPDYSKNKSEIIIAASGGEQTNNTGSIAPVVPASPSVTTGNNIRTIYGTLQADTFTLESGFATTVIFGNGNVEFGGEKQDVINLSHISSTTIALNYANTPGGGVVYNAGNGNSLFDVITLADSSQIYFQGVDAIQFADTTIDLSVVPNDPLFNQQWNLHMMGVHNAWRFTKGSGEVILGIEDTGLAVDTNGNLHPDLRNSILDANNYVAESSNLSHGTSVQSIVAARSNNGTGISGINWVSPTYHVDVIGEDSGDFSLANATQSLINQANGKPLIINLSLMGGDSIKQLVANHQDKVLFVVAAGNGNQSSLSSHASLAQTYDNVIAVGASWGQRDWFGNPKTPGDRINYTGGWGSDYGDGLTGMAASEVPAATANNQSGSVNFGYHYYSDDPNIIPFHGTSASTAHVSGIASLVWSANPGLTASQVKDILSSTAYDLGASGYDTEYGYGLFNADAAVRTAIAMSRI